MSNVGAITSCLSMADVLHVRSEHKRSLRKIREKEDCTKQQVFFIVKESFLGPLSAERSSPSCLPLLIFAPVYPGVGR